MQRNAYLGAAIAALHTQSDKLVCARAAFFQQLANQKQTELGVTPKQFLIDLLSAKNQELLTTAAQTGGFSGTADLQEKGRSLTLDALAPVSRSHLDRRLPRHSLHSLGYRHSTQRHKLLFWSDYSHSPQEISTHQRRLLERI